MAPRSTKMGAASRVASEIVAPTPSSVNDSTKTTLKGTASPETTYCQYLGSLVAKLNRAARIPKLMATPKVIIPKTSVIVYKCTKFMLLIIGLVVCSWYILPPHRGPLAVLYKYFPKTKSSLQQLIINISPGFIGNLGPVNVFLPYLNTAPVINTRSFEAGEVINVGSETVAEYKIINAATHLGALRNASVKYRSGQPKQMHEALDSLFTDILPHVRRDGAPVSHEELLYCGLFTERGAYFPAIHWDVDWFQFPTADGFQIWFLMEENDEDGGNMFLATTDDLGKNDPPVGYVPGDGGAIFKGLNDVDHNPILKRFTDINDSGLEFHYLGMRAGDCLIFSKRTLHMSDPRPFLSGRLANRVAMRLVVPLRSKDKTTIPYSPNSILPKTYPMMSGLQHMALKQAKKN